MKKYPISLVVFVVVAGLIFLLNQGTLEAQEEVEKVEEKTSSEEPKLIKKKKSLMFHLDPFIVNLAKSGGNRFLKVTVSLEMSSPDVRFELKKILKKSPIRFFCY